MIKTYQHYEKLTFCNRIINCHGDIGFRHSFFNSNSNIQPSNILTMKDNPLETIAIIGGSLGILLIMAVITIIILLII